MASESLLEMTAQIVAAHAGTTSMSKDGLLETMTAVHTRLKELESGQSVAETPQISTELEEEKPARPAMTVKKAFKKNHEISCMVCGKGGFKTLGRHLQTAHGMKPSAYRKEFGIPSKQKLVARDYSETRRAQAVERGLADNLAKARAARVAKLAGAPKKEIPSSAATPAAASKTPAKASKKASGPKGAGHKTAIPKTGSPKNGAGKAKKDHTPHA